MAFSLTHSQILFANCADRVTMSLVLYAAWENVDVCNMYTVSLSLLKVHSTGADPGFLKGGGPGADTGFFTSTPLWTLSA